MALLHRLLINELLKWKNKAERKPLLLRGVRQCGKTYLLREFGRLYYEDTAYFNFEDTPALFGCFERDLHPPRIVKELGALRNMTIEPRKTLIILDEIQLCGNALTALKYFCENAREYDIVCAGSLLGVALAEKTSFPVGKVEFLTLRPLNFYEYMLASGKQVLADNLREDDSMAETFSGELRGLLHDYFVTGGMPEVVKTWIETGYNIGETENVQQRILDSYEVDFVKYAPVKDFPKLSAIWQSIPSQLAKDNSKFMFSQVKDSWRARDLEDALQWLIRAGLVYKVDKIEKPFFPLSSYADHKFFKLYMCDIGLLRKMSGLPASVIYESSSIYSEFKGAMAENYVLCELMNQYRDVPFFWKSNNRAEVDFVVQSEEYIIPVEVKAGRTSHARSLTEYCTKYNPEMSFIVSMERKSGTIPLYMMWKFRDCISKRTMLQ